MTGPIPPELSELEHLWGLFLENNALTGPIPVWLGDLPRLEFLTLSGNALTGRIPPELGKLPGLSRLGLASNRLSGPVPDEFGGMTNLRRLYLTNNPAVVVDAPRTLPHDTEEHRIAGRTAGGRELFSLSFTMPEIADGDGNSSFAFVLPARRPPPQT